MEEVWFYFVDMAMAFRRLQTASEVYRLMFEGVSRRRYSQQEMRFIYETVLETSVQTYLLSKALIY
jgi:heme oxygenase